MNVIFENIGIIIQLMSFILVISACYWIIKNDIKTTNLEIKSINDATNAKIDNLKKETETRIKNIEDDRLEKWQTYYLGKAQADAKISEQCKKLNEILIMVAKIQKDISWIMKKGN